jgi:signal transduction histidine kinase
LVQFRTTELHETQDQLRRAERLSIMGQMAGGIAHELRGPLGVISNASYYLNKTLPNVEDDVKECLDIISEEVKAASKIINDLLDYARRRPTNKNHTSLQKLVETVLIKYPPLDHIKVQIDFPDNLYHVFVDESQIEQILSNLISNACHAMKDGGTLTIQADNKKACVYLYITDTGCGISEEDLEKIFEPLFTTKSRGIGIGLPLSRRLVEANGGKISVKSKINQGTTFTIELPTN